MGSITTEYGDISPRTSAYADVDFLERAQPRLTTERFGQPRPIPQKHSKTITFRRYEDLATVEAPLAEGVPPTGQKMTKTDVSCTLEQYGDFTEITDVIADTHEDPVFKEANMLLSEQAAKTIELVRIAVIKAGTNVFYAGTGTTRLSVDAGPARKDFRKIVRGLNRYNASTIEEIVKASPDIDTEPVNPAFFGMCHTDLKSDLRGMTSFIEVKNYSDSDRGLPSEVGNIEDTRIIATTMFEPWQNATTATSTTYLSGGAVVTSAGTSDVYPIIVVGKNAYGIVPLQGMNSVKIMAMNPEKVDKSDKLAQVGFVSWKMYQAVCILNQNFMTREECLCTANPT
ncbi:MAG: N4-gp56 family major capsid protein [Candidatus Peribacteraceae bacterium]|nr:N4-gp56 family major capsid protein [Candidatus Peribacteraceae bacterium]